MVAGIFTWIQAQQLGQRSGELSGTAETQLETVLRTGGGHQNSSGKSAGDEGFPHCRHSIQRGLSRPAPNSRVAQFARVDAERGTGPRPTALVARLSRPTFAGGRMRGLGPI